MEYGEELAVEGVEMEIERLLHELNVGIEARFGGDIRGPTVRLKLPSGRANGFMDGLWVVFADDRINHYPPQVAAPRGDVCPFSHFRSRP